MTNSQPEPDLSTAAILALAAMALGRIEEICYSSSRPAAGSKVIEIIGVVTHFKVLTAGDEDQPGAGVGQPPGPFAPRRPNAMPGEADPHACSCWVTSPNGCPVHHVRDAAAEHAMHLETPGTGCAPNRPYYRDEPVTVHYTPGREAAAAEHAMHLETPGAGCAPPIEHPRDLDPDAWRDRSFQPPIDVPHAPGPSQNPACNACNAVHPFGTPCNTDTADTAVMDAVR